MKRIYICDYIDPIVNCAESLVIEADSMKEAEKKAIGELKTLNIPKRYLLNIEEVF